MSRAHRWSLALLILAAPGSAAAAPPQQAGSLDLGDRGDPAPQKADVQNRNTLLVPTKLSGSTDGKAKLEFGFGLGTALGQSYDLSVSVTGSVATVDGGATLFSSASGSPGISQSLPWNVGLSTSLARLTDPKPLAERQNDLSAARTRAFLTCDARCAPGSKDDFCKSRFDNLKKRLVKLRSGWPARTAPSLPAARFCADQVEVVTLADAPGVRLSERLKARKDALDECLGACAEGSTDPFCSTPEVAASRAEIWDDYSPEQFCAAGQELIKARLDLEGRSLVPVWILNTGFGIGRQEFKYRKSDGTAAAVLVAHDDYVAPWSAGAAYIAVPRTGALTPTFELQGIVSSSYTASVKTVKSCKPAGNVPRTDSSSGAIGPTDPGQVCSESPLDAPTRESAATFVFRVGVFDGSQGRWRVALGPEISIPWDDKGVIAPDFAFRIPIYGSFSPFKDLDYKGILRLSPAVTWTHDSDGRRDVKVLVEVAVLGQRRLFSDRFDNL